jgi:hypothetical protein
MAQSCTLSNEQVFYFNSTADTVSFTLAATVPYGEVGNLSFSVVAVPTYYDINNNVVASNYTDTVATGGSMTFPYSQNFTMYPNPRSDIASYKPSGAVTYKYTYTISAKLVINGVTVFSPSWTDPTSSGSFPC